METGVTANQAADYHAGRVEALAIVEDIADAPRAAFEPVPVVKNQTDWQRPHRVVVEDG